jgi:hypothetical protein
MKRNLRKIWMTAVGLFAVLLTFGTAPLSAQSVNTSGAGRLEGTWNVRVTIRNCQTGNEIRSFDSLGIFMAGGTTIDSTSGTPQALKTPGHGIWEHVTGDTYRFQFKSFSFDPAGDFTGWTVIRHQANLNHNANAYVSSGTAEVHAANGALMFVGCSTTQATRFIFD